MTYPTYSLSQKIVKIGKMLTSVCVEDVLRYCNASFKDKAPGGLDPRGSPKEP